MNENVKEQLDIVLSVFNATQIALEALADGERVQIKDLAKTVGLSVAKDPKDVLGFVYHYAHNNKVAYVTRGKHGGVVKGTKPVKTDKPKKSSKTDDAVNSNV